MENLLFDFFDTFDTYQVFQEKINISFQIFTQTIHCFQVKCFIRRIQKKEFLPGILRFVSSNYGQEVIVLKEITASCIAAIKVEQSQLINPSSLVIV